MNLVNNPDMNNGWWKTPECGLNDKADIPAPWRHMLTTLQMFFPDAVIAGGCLRDRDTGVKVKDIDVFMPAATSTENDLQTIAGVLRREGWDVSCHAATMYPQGMDTRVIGVLDTSYPGCPPIQIIVGEWFTDRRLLDKFDFGICQIMYDGRDLIKTRDYDRDFVNAQFRIVTERSDLAFVQSINRWARLKGKYPTWTFHLGTRGSTTPPFRAAP
jgi:hypothetical protein